MNLKTWLNRAQSSLEAKGIGSAKIDSELILSYVLHKDRAYIVSLPELELTVKDEKRADESLQRRLQNEPIAYIVGKKEFYDHSFKSDNRALIPRWESELMVETAMHWLNHQKDMLVAEIGTGSGAIILTIAQQFPNSTYIASDISQDALDLAQENARDLHIKDIEFIRGDLGDPLLKQGYNDKISLLLANLPYIRSDLLINLEPDVRYYEPNIALEGGNDGLDLYRQFFSQAQLLLTSPGLLLCEHDYDQGDAMRQLAIEYFPHASIKTISDHLGHARLLYCQVN